jgi:hypothetical protein
MVQRFLFYKSGRQSTTVGAKWQQDFSLGRRLLPLAETAGGRAFNSWCC